MRCDPCRLASQSKHGLGFWAQWQIHIVGYLGWPFPDLLPQFLLDDIALVARDELMHRWSIRSEDAQQEVFWIDSR
jgi:hypothetical protein